MIVACRENVGSDWLNYVNYYNHGFTDTKSSGQFEYLFAFLRNLSYSIGFTHAGFFFIVSFLSLWVIYKASKLLRIKYFMIVFLIYYSMYFLNYQINIVRHGAMASFVWLGFAYKSKNDDKKSLLSMVLASGFHISALIFVPLLFIINKRINKKWVTIIILTSFTCVFLGLSQRILAFFPFLALFDRTAGYMSDAMYEDAMGLSLGNVFNLFIFLFVYIRYNDKYHSDANVRVLLNSVLLSFALISAFNAFGMITRICSSMNMAIIFLFPYIMNKLMHRKLIRICFSVITYLYILMHLNKALQENQELGYSEMIPYVFNLYQLF